MMDGSLLSELQVWAWSCVVFVDVSSSSCNELIDFLFFCDIETHMLRVAVVVCTVLLSRGSSVWE